MLRSNFQCYIPLEFHRRILRKLYNQFYGSYIDSRKLNSNCKHHWLKDYYVFSGNISFKDDKFY